MMVGNLIPQCLFKETWTHFDLSGGLLGASKCYVLACLRVTWVWPWRNCKHSLLYTGRTGPLSKMMTKPPFIFCLSFPRTAHCRQIYPSLKSFMIKNNGGSCGHGAQTVFIPLFLGFSIIFSPRRCWLIFATVLTKLFAHIYGHEKKKKKKSKKWGQLCRGKPALTEGNIGLSPSRRVWNTKWGLSLNIAGSVCGVLHRWAEEVLHASPPFSYWLKLCFMPPHSPAATDGAKYWRRAK